jgi:hypothetical protein
MTNADIAYQRLHNQRITKPSFQKAEDAVAWLAAVQSQDYAGAKWALALRGTDITEAAIEQAFNDGTILRTHAVRPTWHFVRAEDIRWILLLTAPRIHAISAYMYRKFGLDSATTTRAIDVLTKALRDHHYLTREELGAVLGEAGIDATGMHLGYILFYAEVELILCSGPRRGKQFTYGLVDERAPQAKRLPRDEALAEFSTRFFNSRGPATVKDFAKWSGLTIADAKAGLEMAKHHLISEIIDGTTYWLAEAPSMTTNATPVVHLLPNYDEYVSSYADHSAMITLEAVAKWNPDENRAYPHMILCDGMIVGIWHREISKGTMVINTILFSPFTDAQKQAIAAAAQRYSEYLGMPVVLPDLA